MNQLKHWIRLLFIVMLLVQGQGTHAQANNIVFLKSLPGKITDFESDNLGNLYTTDAYGQLKKLNNNFDSVGVFNDVRNYGTLYSIDATNPLKLLLFYKDFGTIVVLDRFLNIRTTIDLRRQGIMQCGAIAQSYDNNIWLYDEMDSRIKKIDEGGQLLLESPDFRISFDDPPHPVSLIDNNRTLYAYDSLKGLLVLDYFGAYKNLVAYKNWRNVQALGKGLAATDTAGLVLYTPNTPDTKTLALPGELLTAKKIKINGNRIYALQPTGSLHIYQVQL